jgi:flagellar basal body P-ring formation protein FlgA
MALTARTPTAAGILAILICLVGAVRVSALPAAPGESGKLHEAIAEYVATAMALPADAVRVELTGKASVEPALFRSGVSCEVESSSMTSPVGNVHFTLRFFDGGRFVKEQTAQAKVEILRDFVVSARALDRETQISDEDVRLVQKWVKRVSPNTVTDINDAIGKRICTSVRAGTELTRSMLREMIVVRKGKGVRIELEQGPLVVTAVGTSEDNGTVGSLIKVRNSSSNRIIWARVIGESAVRVEF